MGQECSSEASDTICKKCQAFCVERKSLIAPPGTPRPRCNTALTLVAGSLKSFLIVPSSGSTAAHGVHEGGAAVGIHIKLAGEAVPGALRRAGRGTVEQVARWHSAWGGSAGVWCGQEGLVCHTQRRPSPAISGSLPQTSAALPLPRAAAQWEEGARDEGVLLACTAHTLLQ